MSQEPPTAAELALELSASYAHRVGDDVHVVLELADPGAAGGPTQLELRTGKRSVRVPVTGGDRSLDSLVPSARLRPGLWRLALVGSDGDVRPVQGRLLNSRRQPVALLPGPTPTTQMAPPQPAPTPAPSSGRARAYKTAATLANRGLALLPDQRASKYRAVLKKAGHRVLG